MREQIEAELLSILTEVMDGLPKDDVRNIKELFEVGEYGVGFENLCTQLYEYDVRISPSIFKRLEFLGNSMDIKGETCAILKNLIH